MVRKTLSFSRSWTMPIAPMVFRLCYNDSGTSGQAAPVPLWRNAMQLEDYFDFQSPNDIRIKGHRIGIEDVLYEYIHREQTPEQIVRRFPSLNLEKVHATILYYLANKEQVTQYLTDWIEYCRQAEAEFDRNPPPFVERIRKLRAERDAARTKAG
jgi:uncharacterized protein (DUF433 family)